MTTNGDKMTLSTQKRATITGATGDITCSYKNKLKIEEHINVSHAEVNYSLDRLLFNKNTNWKPVPCLATKHFVNNTCTEADERNEDYIETDVE